MKSLGYPMNTEAKRTRVAMARTDRQKQEADGRQAISLVATIKANVDNAKLSDKEFRDFIRNSTE